MEKLERLMAYPYLYYILWQRLLALLAAERVQINTQQKTSPLRGCSYLAKSPRGLVEFEWGWETSEDHIAYLFVSVRPVEGVLQITAMCKSGPVADEWAVESQGRQGGKNLFPHFAAIVDTIPDGHVAEAQAFRYIGEFIRYFKRN